MSHVSSAHSRAAMPAVASLQAFVHRMAGHGRRISTIAMTHDRRYALQQLSEAHTLADDNLRELAVALFRDIEQLPA